MKRKCLKCKKKFLPAKWNQKYCGRKDTKGTCSWTHANTDRGERRWKQKNYREYQRVYGKKWMKEQRKKKSPYAIRNLVNKRNYYYRRGKEMAKLWRKKNMNKVLFWNKRRVILKKNVKGSYTYGDWSALVKKNHNRCVLCHSTEEEIRKKWQGTHFTNLTADHMIPLSKGGTNYISNIQPLCISCNAKKHAK